jgi:hypothetical protein
MEREGDAAERCRALEETPSNYELRDVFHMTLTTHQRESS